MTRCAKFHHLYDEVGNFCGMSPQSISYYKAYRETVKKLVSQGLNEDFVFENFSEGPARILSSIKDDETRTNALAYISACLHRGEKITEGDLRGTLKAWRDREAGVCDLTNVKNGGQPAPGLPKDEIPIQPSLAQQQAAKAPGHINNGADVAINPVIINDTYRQSPFQTGAEVKAHDTDPLGIDKNAAGQPILDAVVNPVGVKEHLTVTAETDKQKRIRLAKELLYCYPERVRLTVTDILRDNPSWNVSDVFYFGIEALANSKPQRVK